MKLPLSLVLLSTLTLVACEGSSSKKSAPTETITYSEMEKIGSFHRAFENNGRDAYSPERLVQIEGNQLTILTLHPSSHEVFETLDKGAVRFVEVYEIERKASGIRLSKLIRMTENCKIVIMQDSTSMNLGFKRDRDNSFTAVMTHGRLSGFTKATPEQIERINAVAECSDTNENQVAPPAYRGSQLPPEPHDWPTHPGKRPRRY